MLFEKVSPDGFFSSDDCLTGFYGAAAGSSCCILGSGPSVRGKLPRLSLELRRNGIAPFSINWGGYESGWKCYPALWTSYDPCDKFSSHIFRDPSVLKLVLKDRSAEWLAGGKFAAHECPNTRFFAHEEKGVANMLGYGKIVDARDSFLQAVDLAIRLGFKTIYLAGCDFFVSLSDRQQQQMHSWFTEYAKPTDDKPAPTYTYADPNNSLLGALTYLAQQAKTTVHSFANDLRKLDELDLYSFGNAGSSWFKAASCDHHYFASVNWLMRGRRCLDALGVQVALLDTYTSPRSRLRRFFDAVDLPAGTDLSYYAESPNYSDSVPRLGTATYVEMFSSKALEQSKAV